MSRNCSTPMSDEKDRGLEARFVIDRDTASRLGISHESDRQRAL